MLKDSNGLTALDIALYAENTVCIKLLKDASGNFYIKYIYFLYFYHSNNSLYVLPTKLIILFLIHSLLTSKYVLLEEVGGLFPLSSIIILISILYNLWLCMFNTI